MAYKKQEMIDQAVNAINEHGLVYIDEILSFVPYSKATFYNKKLEQSDAIKKALTDNRVNTKSKLRKAWLKSKNPALQISLYKLIGTDDEVERLNGSKQKVEHSGQIGASHKLEIEFIPSPIPIHTDDVISLEDIEKLKELENGRG